MRNWMPWTWSESMIVIPKLRMNLSHTYLAYRPGVPLVAAVWQAGDLVAGRPAMA